MDTNPGFFSEPVTELPDMGELNLPTSFPNPFEGVGPVVTPSAPSSVDPFAGQLERELSKGPSFEASTAPTFFNWEASNADRYVNSEYFKQLGFRPDRDNETLYGNRQTFGDTMQQAFAGSGELAWNTFVDGWKGWGRLVNSLVHWDASLLMGTPEELETLDREQKRIMNKYAIFQTPESEGRLFTRQFLGDMIQQTGFAVGTMAQFAAEELLTMGAASLLKGGTTALKLSNLSKWARTGEILADMKKLGDLPWKTKTAARLFEGLKDASSVTKYIPGVGSIVEGGLDVMRGIKRGDKAGQLFLTSLNGLRRTLSEANMAFTESRMEAAGTYGELKDRLYQTTLQEKGDVSPEDLERIEDLAQKAAWSNFWVNAGVISISNRLEYDNLFRKFGADKRATREMIEAGELAAKDAIDPKYFQKVTGASARDVTGASGKVTVKAGQELTQVYEKGMFGTFGNLKKIQADFGRKTAAWEATKSLGRNLFKWEVDEGLQELVQEGSNIAIQQYYTDLYMGKETGTNDSYINKAIRELSDTNGLKVFLMGAATGRLLAPIHKGIGFVQDRFTTSAAQRQAARSERQEAIGTVNEFFKDTGYHTKESVEATIKEFYRDPSRYAPEAVANLKAQNRASEVMEQAITDNNKHLYEHAKDGAFAKAVMAAKKLNMVESMVDTIKAYGEHFDDKEFYEAFKVDFKGHEDRRSVKEYMDKLAGDVQRFSDRFDLLRNKYADVARYELYAGKDRDKMKMVRRALDDTIEWMAVSEYRAERTAERGLQILEEAAKLPTIGSSAHLIFQLMSDNDNLKGEMLLLDQEIASLKEGNLEDEATKKQLELKQEQRRVLGRLDQPGEGPANQRDAEHSVKANFDIMEPDTVIDIIREFGNVTNKVLGNTTEVMPDDAADVYFKLRDYRQLGKEKKGFMNIYAFLANQKNFTQTLVRNLEGLQHLQAEQIKNALEEAEEAQTSDSPTKQSVVNDLTEEELQSGKPLDDYHGFQAGDKILNTSTSSEYIIVKMTTNGIQWQDTEDDAIKGIMSLDRFDKLVGANKIKKVAEGKPFNVEFGPDENKELIDGLDGVFIVKDNNRKDTPFVLTDENNRELDASGKVVAADEEPARYDTEEEAKQARDSILDVRKKEREVLEAPFVFDGKKMKYGTILVKSGVGSQESGGKKERFKVVTRGVQSQESGVGSQESGVGSRESDLRVAELEKRKKEAMDAVVSSSQKATDAALNAPAKTAQQIEEDVKKALIENKEIIDEIEELYKIIDEDSNEETEDRFDELQEQLTDRLGEKALDWSFANEKVKIIPLSIDEDGFTIVTPENVHSFSEAFQVGNEVSVRIGQKSMTGKVSKVNKKGRILEVTYGNTGHFLIYNGTILTVEQANDLAEIQIKFGDDIDALKSQSGSETVGRDANSQQGAPGAGPSPGARDDSGQGWISVKDKIEIEPLGGGQRTFIDSMDGYEVATEAAQRWQAGKKEGAYRLPSVHYLAQAQGVPQNGEDPEVANERLQELIRKTPPKDLQEKLVVRVSKNPNQKKARPARENKADQNDFLEEHDSNLIVELRFNNETIGYLPFFDQYNYKDENGKVKIPDLTVEQFQAIVDTGDRDPYALLAEFQRYYEEAQKVYVALSSKVRDSGHKDIKGDELKALFTVYSSAGDNHWVEKAGTPLKALRYNGVGGKRVLLVQALTRDEKGMPNRSSQVIVEGGLSAEEQKKLEERIKLERDKKKHDKEYDMAAGLGEYVAVVELPNKELRFVPLDLPSMTKKDMDAVVQRINEQSKKAKEENLVEKDGAVQEDSGSYNAEFNRGLLKEFFIHVPALGRGVWVDLSLTPRGDLLFSFRSVNKGKPQFILLQGAQPETPLSFSSFSDLLSKLNAAIQTHDASAAAVDRIGLELTEDHFKKHLADWSTTQAAVPVDFDAVGNMPALVHEEVLHPAVLTVTSNSDVGDPYDIFLRNLMTRAEEVEQEEEEATQTPPNQPGGNKDSGNNKKSSGNNKKGSGSNKKSSGNTKKSSGSTKSSGNKNSGNNNKKSSNTNTNTNINTPPPKKPAGLVSEMLELEAKEKKLPEEIYLELLEPELEKLAEKEKEGVLYEIDFKALRDRAVNDPRVKALKDRIAAIRAELKKDRKGKANKVLTHDKLSKAHVEEIQRFEEWMDANLPDFIDVELKDLLVQNMGKYGITVGQFILQLDEMGKKRVISIVTDPNAPYKYHEAFHAIFRLLLTDEQIDRLMQIARQEVTAELRRKKTTLAAELEEMRRLAPEQYGPLSEKELEERYYEEHLADRFDHWKTDTDREKNSWLKQFFRWFYDLIRRFNKSFASRELDGLFREINAGKFKEARLAVNRFTKEAQETLAPQVVLKSIKIGEIGVRDEDGEEMLVSEYLSESKGTALASSIAGTYYDRMMKMRAKTNGSAAGGTDESPSTPGDSSGKVPDVPDAGVAAEDVLEQVLADYAKLYDRDHPNYIAKLSTKETAREYWAILPELDKLKRLFEHGREEIKDAVRVHLRQMNLMQSEEAFKIEDKQDELGDRAMVDFHKNKESIGGFESLSKWFRQYIATTTYQGKDLYGNTELKEGEPLLQAVDANRVYSGILKLVAGTDNVHQMLLRMQEMAQKKEYGYANEHSAHFIKRFFNDLGIVVTEDDYEVQKKEKIHLFNMVMKGLQQYRLDYIFFSKELGEKDTKIVLSNRRDSKRKQFSIWYNAFGEVFFHKYKRKARVNQPRFLKEAIAGLNQFKKLARLGKITDEGLERQSREISDKLEKGLGINMHPLFIQYSLLSPIKEKNLTNAQLRLLQSLPQVEWMSLGDVELFIKQLEEGRNPFVWNRDAADVPNDIEDDRSNAVSMTSRLMEFAESNALFDESVNVSSFTNADRETVYGHQLPTFHLVKVTELSRDLKDPDQYTDDDYLKDNFLVEQDDVRQMAGDLRVSRLDGMNAYYEDDDFYFTQKEGSKRKGVTYGDFGEREMLLALFELYGTNKGYKRPDGSWFRTSRHLIRVLEASNTGDTVNLPVFKAVERGADGKLKLSAKTLNALKQEVRREFDRIGRVKREIAQIEEEKKSGKRVLKEIDGYHNSEKGKGPRGLTLFKTRIMLGTLADAIEQEAQQDNPNFKQFEERLELQFKQYWIEGTGETKSQLNQLIDTLKDRSIIQEKNGKLKNVLLPQFMGTEVKEKSDTGTYYAREGLFLEEDQLKQNIAQVMLNDFINTQAFNQLLLGDQAESLVDYVDMVKRAKGANASGASIAFDITAPELGIEHGGRKSHIVQIDDPKFFAKYLGRDMEKADAQMWMTTKFLRYTLFGLGKLTPSQAALLDKIERGESVNVEDIYGKGGSVEYDGQTNSIKLVYYDGHRYIKTSGFLLTKELTSRWDANKGVWVARKGYKELHQLRTKLETFEIEHETICTAVPKSASKGEKANTARGIIPTVVNGQLVDPISDWNFQELDNRYWRLQTENPSNKIEITDPTQAKQLILAEQDDATEVYFPWSDKEKPITVGELKKIYLDTTAQRARVKYRQARNQIFGFEEALTEIKNSADLKKVTPKLEAFLKKAVDVLRISAADSQLLEFFSPDADGNLRYNLNHPSTLDKFTQLFLAYFTKGVMSEKVPGHAVTLVSSYGMQVIKKVLEVGSNGQPKRWEVITRRQYELNPEEYEDALEWENDRREYLNLAARFNENKGKRPTYILDDLRHNVPEYALDEDGNIKKDARGNEIILGYYTEYMTAAHDAQVMELIQQNGGVIPDVIAKSFGVRIPSQDKHSFVNLRMVDFLPAHYGSSGVFAPELVEISGADFDVDKVYISTKEFYARRPLQKRMTDLAYDEEADEYYYAGKWTYLEPTTDSAGAEDENFFYHFAKRRGEEVEWVAYGSAVTDKGRFNEFVRYQKAKNKEFRKEYYRRITKRGGYAAKQKEAQDLAFQIEDLELLNSQKKSDKQKLANLKSSHKGVVDELKKIQSDATLGTLRALGLPDSEKAYMRKVRNEGEQNIGVLNNKLVDAKIQLLGNKHMVEGAGPSPEARDDSQRTGDANSEQQDPLKDVASTTRALEQVLADDPDAIKGIYGVTSFETSKGSVYTVLPDGRIQRYKTATKEQGEPQDLIVFARFKDPDQEQAFLAGIQRRDETNTKVYVTDSTGKTYNTNEEAIGKDVRLVLVDSKKNEILEVAETSLTPKEGYKTFDQRRFKKDGESFRQSHIGNAVSTINRASAGELAQLYHKAKADGSNPGLVKVVKGAVGRLGGAPETGPSPGARDDSQRTGDANSQRAREDKRKENPIAFEVASVKPLQQLVEDFKKIFKDVKSLMLILEEGNADVDTFMGKLLAFRNNKEGAKNIGPAVNSMLAYALLNTFKVKMREHTVYEDYKGNQKKNPIWKFKLDGVEFNSYEHTRAYNPKTGKFDGERIMHHISTIVSAMTDNAKERLAAKLGLNIEAVGLVSNLIAQGVPMDKAVMFLLQPVVRDYYKRTSNLNAAVKTEEEEDVNKYAIGENMLEDLARELGSAAEEPVELTSELLRDNILTEGRNKQYEYAVLDAFLKLRKQSEYFNDVSGVMKVVKGMQTSHEDDNKLEEKMESLGLRDSDEVFNRKYIPFDLRQVMLGVDTSQPFNAVIAEYLKNFDEIRLLSQKVFIERTEGFRYITDVISKNLRVRGFQRTDFPKKLKKDLLSFLSIKAYMKLLRDNNRLERLSSLTPALLFDGEAVKKGGDYKDIIDVVQEIRAILPENKFAKNFLNLVPTHIMNEDGTPARNPYNRNGINRAEINTWAKLDALQIEQLQSSFLDILQNEDTRQHAWALFHYLLVKDGGQFRNGSFIRYLPNAMFKDLLDATNRVNEVMITGFEDGDFESVFGGEYFDVINEFVEGYLLNVTNTQYVHNINVNLNTAHLEYEERSPTSDFSESETKLTPEEQQEVDDYVPQTFTVTDGDKTIEIDLTGGIREDPSQRGAYDKIEKAKYAKNVNSLKLRGFRMGKMTYAKKTRSGDYDGTGKRNAVELPLVLRDYVVTEDGPIPMLYVLSGVEDENGNWKDVGDDITGIFQPDEHVARSTRARYVLYGAPSGHAALWGGSFMFGPADTRAYPRIRKSMGNYGGFDVDEDTDVEDDEEGGGDPFGTPLPNLFLEDFKQQFGVDSIEVVDGDLVFSRNGEVLPNQEFLFKAYRLLHDAANKSQRSEVVEDEDEDEESESSGSFYLDDEDDEEDPPPVEDANYKAMVGLINEGPLGC